MIDREEAKRLLCEYTQSASLIKHALGVEAAMRWYSRYFQVGEAAEEMWAITGLLHDFDYERYPAAIAPDGHPFKGNQILGALGYSDEVRCAIMGHAAYTNTPRDSLMSKTLFAVDELCGLITASVLVRPDRSIHCLESKSVRKKMKDKAFAKGCSREDIELGAKELGIDLEQHIQNVIEAMRLAATELGLDGVLQNQQTSTGATS